MPLPEETLRDIDSIVRSGFESRDRVIEIFTEEMYAPGDLDPEEIALATDLAIKAWEEARKTWPAVTDWDRLDQVFQELKPKGVICLHHAGHTQSDGYEDFEAALRSHRDPGAVRGYCFYHSQDTMRAVQGEGLYLAFGPAQPVLERTEGPVIGRLIASALTEAGLPVKWDGSFESRLFIPQFDWKKR